jgi:hypothetical protein
MIISKRKQLISHMLAPQPGMKTGADAFADQALWLWERIAFHLTPLIGETGFHSLYFRALQLASAQCPHLTFIKHCRSADELFQKLKEDLSTLDSSDAENCSNILLNKFTDLMSSMIGDLLMEQILHFVRDDHAARGLTQEIKK